MRVVIQHIKLIYMQFSKFIIWLWGFLSAVIKKSTSRNLINQKSYDQLRDKVRILENIIAEETLKTERLKTNFLNNIYHEIRTPMNSIVGFTELLKQEELTEYKKSTYLNRIRSSSQDFLKIMDQLLDASLIESGNVELQNEECNLIDLLNEVYHYYTIQKHIMEKECIALLKNPDKFYPDIHIMTDRNRLFQILSILVENALKFTEKGVVEFGYKVLNDNKVLFYIKDSGIGIAKNKNHLVFEKFQKLESCFGQENRGLGLGLCIAKGLVKILSGDIWIESNNFGGSTFKFSIPVEKMNLTVPEEKTAGIKAKSKVAKLIYSLFL